MRLDSRCLYPNLNHNKWSRSKPESSRRKVSKKSNLKLLKNLKMMKMTKKKTQGPRSRRLKMIKNSRMTASK